MVAGRIACIDRWLLQCVGHDSNDMIISLWSRGSGVDLGIYLN